MTCCWCPTVVLTLLALWSTPHVTAFASPASAATASGITTTTTTRNHNHIIRIPSLRILPKTTTTLLPLGRRSSSRSSNTRLTALWIPRGGGAAASDSASNIFSQTLTNCRSSPASLFNVTLMVLAVLTVAAKLLQRAAAATPESDNDDKQKQQAPKTKPASIKSLQQRFLAVFWLLRCSDWLQGPYFYEVYASKVLAASNDGGAMTTMSFGIVSRLFLTGFASTAAFGPAVGRAADTYGRKRATLAFTVLYALGALSTKSSLLQVLFCGRILSGIGTSLLFSAPESWLVAEAQNSGDDDPDGRYLGETFGLAYAGDSIVAIAAGQMAAAAANRRGATGPFELSALFLLVGGILTALLWGENKASLKENETTSIQEAITVVRKDPKIMLVGSVQSLFEAAMYIFVLQWPPAITGAIQKAFSGGAASSGNVVTPYGTIFSCFMACCLLGSTLFGHLTKRAVAPETYTTAFLTVATLAMSMAAWTVKQSTLSLPLLVLSFFAFEVCVGMYFPSIGTLRSRYVPDSHRSVIMNLFGIPLNVLVVSVFLSIQKLGVGGALSISSAALGIATLCMFSLRRLVKEKSEASAS